eukprot:CAMPEP_0113462612 /NCGR_PEP_ID=MMETSP0014_2-20120614/12195_1 /TAXON_ID=2857 /ORGANISM="Nitzschia sp." /LENGTH=400 /DNA_ID=CAMNT_0000354507 /DNA_START=95 /DNA_END=1297 /DNA_ORIENTATION=+ /assembly_acc=CAM_ASM_000159
MTKASSSSVEEELLGEKRRQSNDDSSSSYCQRHHQRHQQHTHHSKMMGGVVGCCAMTISMLVVLSVMSACDHQIMGFQHQQHHQTRQQLRRTGLVQVQLAPGIIDPNDVSAFVSTITDVAAHTVSTHGPSSSILADHHDATQHAQTLLDASSSTLISSTVQAVKAQGHSNPLFGPPDVHLKEVPCHGGFWQSHGTKMCQKSIEPTARALKGLQDQIDQHRTALSLVPEQSTHVTVRSSEVATKATEIMKDKAMKLGMKPRAPLQPIEFDVKTITSDMMVKSNTLPGFAETKSLLEPHNELALQGVPSTAVEAARYNSGMMYGAQLWSVLDKLPWVLVAYAIVEFNFLRNDTKDLYKEDIEDDPVGVTAEVASDAAVRVGIFFLLSAFTLAITETLKVPTP